MDLIPSIDIRGGRSVRLYQGNFSDETVYGDPVTQAGEFAAQGAVLLHVVDLDAARTGIAANGAIVRTILEQSTIPVEVSGGVRSRERAEELIALGAARVVLGSAALYDPDLVQALAADYPDKIVVGLDHKTVTAGEVTRRVVVVNGWEQESSFELLEALSLVDGAPLAAVVATDVGRDSTMSGPDIEGYTVLLESSEHPVVASGGVGAVSHLRQLRDLRIAGRSLAGVIVGKALQSGAITFEEALAACAP